MQSKDHEKLSGEALRAFLARVTEVYADTEENSLRRLREEIRRRLRQSYRDDDTIAAVVTRLTLVHFNELREGRKVVNFHGLLKRVIMYVCYEKDDQERRNPLLLLDEPEGGAKVEAHMRVDDDIELIESELKHQCYRDCLQENPEMLKVFDAYFPEEQIDRSELAKRRTQLAGEVNTPGTDDLRKKNTLQVRIHRWLEDDLAECVRKCFGRESARNVDLERLRQQRQTFSSSRKNIM
jgi:hypothetical protein